MTQLFSDVARAELAADITDVATSFTITSGGSLFPVANTGTSAIGPGADWFKVVLSDPDGYEIVYVRTHTSGSDTFSNVLRGQEGTTARAFDAIHSVTGQRTVVGLRVSAVDFDRFESKEPGFAAGTTSQYYRGDKTWRDFATDVRAAVLTGLSTATNAVISASDTVLGALGKLQKQISDHLAATNNPHSVTKSQVGLGNVDNVSAANLRDRSTHTGTQAISTVSGLQTALDGKESTISAGTTGQYWRGDKTWQTLNKAAVGLSNVDNTSDANKPVSTATQAALNGKANKTGDTFTGSINLLTSGNDTPELLFQNNTSISFIDMVGKVFRSIGYPTIGGPYKIPWQFNLDTESVTFFGRANCTIITNSQGIAARFESGLQIATGRSIISGSDLFWSITGWGAYASLGSVCQFAAAFSNVPALVGMFCTDADVSGRSAYVTVAASPNTVAVTSGSYLATPNTAPGAGSTITLTALAIGVWK